MSDPEPPTAERRPPPPLTVAAGLAGIQGVVTVLVAIAAAASTRGDGLALGVTTGLFFAAYGAALIWCAWGIYRLRPRARGPVLFAQLIWLGVAWSFRHAPTTLVAILVAVSAAITLLGLLTPDSVDALDRPED